MIENRFYDYLDHMRQAVTDAFGFVESTDKADFLEDKRTQQAVEKPHHSRQGRHQDYGRLPRIRRGAACATASPNDFDINFDVVWDTVQTALPELLKQLSACSLRLS